MGNNSLRILCLEDNLRDAEIIQEILVKAGYDLNCNLTSSKKQFETLLDNNKYDIILSDFKLPGFDVFGALQISKVICPDVPFICVSGAIGEEIAIEVLKFGVVDYILKDRLVRLPFAIKRALEQVKEKEIRRHTEEAFRESEERLRITLEATKIGIWDFDFKSNLIYTSSTAYSMLGYRQCDYSQDNNVEDSNIWLERTHPEDRHIIEEITKKIFAREIISYEYTVRMRHAEGSYRWIWVKGEVILDKLGSGNIERLLGIWMDVTERKQMQEEINKREEKFIELFENAPVGYHEIDNQGNIIAVNQTELKMLGYTYEEMKGFPVWKFAKESEESKKRVLGKLAGILPPNKNLEQLIICKNGSTFPALSDDVIFRNEQGKITGIRTTIHDITKRKLAEEKATQLAEIVQSSDDAIIRLTPGGITLSWNKGAENIFGFTESEVIGKSVSLLVASDNINKINEIFSLIRSGKHIDHFDILGCSKDGTYKNISLTISPIRNASGKVIALSTIARDITKRKIVEDRQLVISKILSILNRPNEWQQIINDILIELKIFTEFEAIAIRLKEGKDFPYFVTNGFPEHFVESEIFLCSQKPDNINNNEPYLECMCGNIISQLIDTSPPYFTKGGSFWTNSTGEMKANNPENILQTFTRNICFKEGYESVALIPLKSGEKVIGLLQFNDKQPNRFTLDMIEFFEKIGSTIGIAFKRMQVEKQIRESEERYRFIVDATNDVIYRFNFKTKKYDYINPTIEKLTGYSPEEINEIGFKSIVLKISKYNAENIIIDITSDNSEKVNTDEWHADYQIRTKDGNIIWLSDHSYPWYDETGNFIGTIGILSDITERKNAEEEIIRAKEKAEEMNRLKSNFLANMSHELRTPLIGILGFADILQEDLEEELRKEYAKIISESGTRLKETLNQILDLSKIESKALELNLEEIEVTSYIPDLIKVFQKSAEQKNVELKILTSKELLFCNLDKSLFNSIINNLMNNAVKYTQQGKITVRTLKVTEDKHERVEIQVADTGIGISQENLKIIFEPFRQVSEGLNRKYEGTGLGLTLVKRYVEKMNGSVNVRSKVDLGSIFTVQFPLVKSEPIKNKPVVGANKVAKILTEREATEKPLVLYVEDDLVSQKVIDKIVSDQYSVDFVTDGETAIELVKRKKYEIILMDINLGGRLSGIETTHEIKKLKEYGNTPIIAVTAYAMVGDREKILSEGCTHYISKPFSNSELHSILDEALN